MTEDEQTIRAISYTTIRKVWQEENKHKRNKIIKEAIKEAYIFGKSTQDNFNA